MMTVICKTNINHNELLVLPKGINDDIHAYETELVTSFGYTIDSNTSYYHITVGHSYVIYGILVCNGSVWYLIQDDDNYPVYCPASLFTIENSGVHWDWSVCQYTVGEQKLMLIGYPADWESYEGLTALIGRNNKAIGNFLDYKKQMQMSEA